MFFTDDPATDFLRKDAEDAAWLAKRPECDVCGEKIQEDHCFKVGITTICPDCWRQYVYDTFYHDIEEE